MQAGLRLYKPDRCLQRGLLPQMRQADGGQPTKYRLCPAASGNGQRNLRQIMAEHTSMRPGQHVNLGLASAGYAASRLPLSAAHLPNQALS